VAEWPATAIVGNLHHKRHEDRLVASGMAERIGDTTARVPETASRPDRFDALILRWIAPAFLGVGVRLTGKEHTIGRGPECSVRIDAASISRTHCKIYRDGPVLAFRDLGSTNGTYLNGERVEHGALARGDVFRVGDAVALIDGPEASLERPAVALLAPDLYGGPTLSRALDPARRAASSGLPIVLVGETGTGKERAARAIHDWSGRRDGFSAINCAALPSDLAEAELFGYRKGAFTGAERASVGRLRAAGAGTLLLDEIAELSLPIQAKLLRVLEERRIVPLGEVASVPFEARLLAATQRPLQALVKEGAFRRDLRARLGGLTIELPPLRERTEDIVPLFCHFLSVHSGGRAPAVDPKLAEALCLQRWPDNVRELELIARGLLALRGSEPVLKRAFLQELQDESVSTAPESSVRRPFARRKEHDLHHLAEALRETNGNVAAAAARLGFSRQRAYRLLDGKTATDLLRERFGRPAPKEN
jgi:transcriptional regulator with AAA-type ATPase domain